MPRKSIPAEIRACLAAPLERLGGLDPFELMHAAPTANEALLDAQAAVATMRRKAVRQLRAEGWTLAAIGEQLGIKAQRVHQIETGYDRRERRYRRGTP
jgi:DNA-directed RNA polymerase specialized sigma24 family protein